MKERRVRIYQTEFQLNAFSQGFVPQNLKLYSADILTQLTQTQINFSYFRQQMKLLNTTFTLDSEL